MTALKDQLWELAHDSRWFSGRAGRPSEAELGPELTAPSGERYRAAFLDVAFDDGHTERFFLPLLVDGDVVRDACDHAGGLLELLNAEAPGFERVRTAPSGLEARRYTGEQSNTSVFFGDKVLMKAFRRIEPGVNLDVELHRALAGTGLAAELCGVWSHDGADLAIFLESLPDPTDGYVLACDHARQGTSFESHAEALGVALAAVHEALAERLPTGAVDGDRVAAEFERRLDAVSAEVPDVAPLRDRALASLRLVGGRELAAQRIHGDCHLGQVLLSEGQWRYVDFEGEPLKSLDERREPDSPLRDVAGMLRSFDYAAAEGEADQSWLDACRRAFLRGYGLDPSADDAVLTAYEVDKAAYETVYEARYRPHLLRVPLTRLASLR